MSGLGQPPADQEGMASRNQKLEAELVVLRGQLRRALASLDEARTHYRDVVSSTSWRITAPLRAIKMLLGSMGKRASSRGEPLTESAQHRPMVPRPLFNVAFDSDPEPNRTYRLVDARDAMAPLVRTRAGLEVLRTARIALLGSDELAGCLSCDAEVTVLARRKWRELLQPGRFDYLLVEPAWRLADPEWGYCVPHDGTERAELLEALARCRQIALPIVLWAREDFDAYDSFAWLGACADRIYSIDERIVSRCRADHPSKPVALLALAIQPALHNPIRSYALFESSAEFAGKILYDGWYDLLAQTDQQALVEQLGGDDLRVCESEWEFGSSRVDDAKGLQRHVLGCVDPVGKRALDKLFAAEVFLAGGLRSGWRKRQAMLHAVACGSLALAEGDGHCGPALPDGVVRWTGREQIATLLQWARGQELERGRALHTIRRMLMKEHTYAHRLARIAEDLGLHGVSERLLPQVSAILVTKRPHLLARCIERFRREMYPNKELIVVMHGEHDLDAARDIVHAGEPIRIHGMRAHHSLGACLNFAVGQTDAPYWCKMDDDDFYGRSYLDDMMLAREMIDFDLAGKSPVFTYMQQQRTLYWDPAWWRHANLVYTADENRSALIAGATILARRDGIRGTMFSERRRAGADSQFIGDCLNAGARVLSTDPFGFVRFRAGAAGAHTWHMDEGEFVHRAKPLAGPSAMETIALA